MANNYMQFSETIPCADDEQKRWLLTALEEEEEHVCEHGEEEDSIWVYSEDEANLDVLVALVCAFQEKFNIEEPWSLEYASTCSKPRIGEFGGGAVFCYKGKDEWLNTGAWRFSKEKEVNG